MFTCNEFYLSFGHDWHTHAHLHPELTADGAICFANGQMGKHILHNRITSLLFRLLARCSRDHHLCIASAQQLFRFALGATSNTHRT